MEQIFYPDRVTSCKVTTMTCLKTLQVTLPSTSNSLENLELLHLVDVFMYGNFSLTIHGIANYTLHTLS